MLALSVKLGAPAPLPASCPWNFSPARVPALPATARRFGGSTREMFFRGLLSPRADYLARSADRKGKPASSPFRNPSGQVSRRMFARRESGHHRFKDSQSLPG